MRPYRPDEARVLALMREDPKRAYSHREIVELLDLDPNTKVLVRLHTKGAVRPVHVASSCRWMVA